ncbi:alpha-xylosidase [Subtercola boreus]|uniref:alpha-D-xyloside xylohydrolase n=1 Tax=Subtercola boreus TaxID=120213 RepID=A0A3E0WD14_9MICO|nr:alpha-xylosidase [Subtercola boreus]RFA22684.1 alpha-xylosidase [Subtercola boreus]RFA23039.1 alpha-xylosidase [Subtercola boreus]RFA28792.1 alpha-xylosidase [Subtercola boreus]
MKFSDGFWQMRAGVTPLYAEEAYDLSAGENSLVVSAPTRVIHSRGDTLNRALLTVTLTSPLPNIVGVRIEHFQGALPFDGFDLVGAEPGHGEVSIQDDRGILSSGDLTATVTRGAPWSLTFSAGGRVLTSGGAKSVGYLDVAGTGTFVHEQLALGVGELVYGLGERFGPVVKNGQVVDIWNADGGTSSEQAYKNVPFYLTNRGYGVFVNYPGHVSYEIGSESVERVQFSVPGESLEYYVIAGSTPAEILERYTALTGRPAHVPAWSYGLWLSTSFTTNYDEETVTSFIDAMASRDLPLSVFHFDCFWMREFNWSDFEWDARVFPDPTGMLARLHERDLHVCVWINPYIAQRSALFAEGAALGYLVKRPDGSVWQWDLWQAGMALVDFTNPDATAWYQSKLRVLLDQGVDAFKTDFGERIPLEVDYFDGSSPERMHNHYTQLYNQAVFDVLQDARGEGDAVLFARSATAGGQQLPVHWGGDSTSTYESMAETLRGGLSLAFSGFGFWSHDIGGFEGTPDAGVFKRWTAFGLLSSHSRFHGSDSYRVPWAFDEEAVDVTRVFTKLKLSLMPYLYSAGLTASAVGTPVLRPMQLEFPADPGTGHLETQYLLGSSVLVAPVFTADGSVTFYLPAGTWTNWFDGSTVVGPVWRTEQHGFLTAPVYVRDGTVLPIGARDDRPDYDYLDGLTLHVFASSAADHPEQSVTVTNPDGSSAQFTVSRSSAQVRVTSTSPKPWSIKVVEHGQLVEAINGEAVFHCD